MRIERLDLLAFGPFTNKSLDLSAGDSGLHLIYGDNEAGKSTSLRALTAWLFGVPPRTTDNYLHAYSQLRIRGKLKLAGGEELEFVRKKGAKETVLESATETALDDSVLSSFLPAGIDQILFSKLYGIDHAGLVEGGNELLQQAGDLGQALYSAAAGTASLSGILAELQKGADELFKPRASTRLVNREIAAFKSSQQQIKDSGLALAEWEKLQQQFAATRTTIKQIEADSNGLSKQKSRLERLNRVKAALAERSALLVRTEHLADVLLLPPDFEQQSKTAVDNLQAADIAKTKAETRGSRLQQESDCLNISGELLAGETTIQALQKELGAVEKTIKDRPRQDGKRRLLRNQAELLLKGVRPDIDFADADQLRPLLNNRKWISTLQLKHDLFRHNKEEAATTLRDSEDQRETIKHKLARMAQSNPDLNQLKAAIATARKAGDLEQRLDDTQKLALNGKTACDNELAGLGRFSGAIETLIKTAMPVAETLDTFAQEFDQLAQQDRDYARKKKEIEQELKQIKQDLEVLLLNREIPTISQLDQARASRNKVWDLIKHKYIEKNYVEKESVEFASDTDLTTQYEHKVKAADQVSDRLRLVADQVVKRAELEARIDSLTVGLGEIMSASDQVNQSEQARSLEWNAIWQRLGVEAGTPREMKQWLLRVEQLLANARSTKTVDAEVNRLVEQCNTHKQTVARLLGKFDDSLDLSRMSLEDMVSLGEQRVEQAEATLELKRKLQHALSDNEIGINRTREKLDSIDSSQASWMQQWQQAINGLGLKHDVHPEYTTETLEQLVAFFDKADKAQDLGQRIIEMDQVAKNFEKKVFEFAASIGFNTDGQAANIVATQLNLNLNEALKAQASLLKIEAQAKEVKQEIEDLGLTIQTAHQQLASLRLQAGVAHDSELQLAGASSSKKRSLLQQLETLEQELIRNGDGLSIAELEREADAADIDAIEGELELVSTELKELQLQRDTLRDQRQTLQNQIDAQDGSAQAAIASEQAEQHLAAIVSGVERYLRLRIAALILEQRIEDYRKKNQAPVLARAGELFAKLTLGSYAKLRDELDADGKPIMLGVRANDIEVSVDGMSDGSRDQLYLSLRLATLEQHLNKAEPIPFVVDDILIGFDDNRTRACLEVLAELASTTQVLLFTHHRRVIELSDSIDAQAGIFSHELV